MFVPSGRQYPSHFAYATIDDTTKSMLKQSGFMVLPASGSSPSLTLFEFMPIFLPVFPVFH